VENVNFDKTVGDNDFLARGETIAWEGNPELWPYTLRAFGLGLFGFVWLIIPYAMWTMLHEGKGMGTETKTSMELFLIPFFVIGLMLMLAPIYQFFSHKGTRYILTNKRVVIVQGGLWRNIKFLDYDRIVNTSISAGLVDRYFSSGSIKFFSGEIASHGQTPFSKYDEFCNILNPHDVHNKAEELKGTPSFS
jgi:membrane protein YdbS with pleckstrin-like domain